MTLMQIREMTFCPEHKRHIIVLADASQRLTLTLGAEPDEAYRLAQVMRRGRCAWHPIYDFIQSLLEAFQTIATRVVLADVQGQGIGSRIYFRRFEVELDIPCYAPDALAFALRANVPIYATAEVLAHATLLSPFSSAPDGGSDVKKWLEHVKPKDF
jgi:bifunctional DNase/RNase